MNKNDKRQTTTLMVGGIVAILAILAGLISAEVPQRLRLVVTNQTAWAIAVTCTVPLLILLAANQISALLKSSTDREEIVNDIVRILPNSSLIIHFETSASAMEYLIENIPRSRRLLNTRLARREIEEGDPENVRVTQRFDAIVWQAIENGTDYHWIVSPEYSTEAVELLNKRKKHSASQAGLGVCCCWTLKSSDVPFFHFSVIEYLDHSELMLGWALTSTRSFGEKVFLIREDRMVQYFKRLFETYVGVSQAL